MAVPKRKTTPSRRGMRRSHDALRAEAFQECPNCGELHRPHNLCIAIARRLKRPEPSLQCFLDIERCARGDDDVEVTPAIEQRRVGHRTVGIDVGARKCICHGRQEICLPAVHPWRLRREALAVTQYPRDQLILAMPLIEDDLAGQCKHVV